MSEETIASEVVAASLGGAISAAVLYPLEVLKTKMQSSIHSNDNNTNKEDNAEAEEDENERSMLQFAWKLYQREGSSVFLRGWEISSFQSALEKALYFFAYTALKAAHQTITGGARLKTGTNLLLGCLAEWAHLPITLPVDAWTTKIQTQASTSETPLAILILMLSKNTTKDWYKGITAYYLLCFKPALQYTVYEQVKQVVLAGRSSQNLSAAEAFVLGMIARTIATVLLFPFLRAKVVMQTSDREQNESNTTTTASRTTMDILWQQWQQSGLEGLYYGIGPELSRGILSSAFMLMIKERIAIIVRRYLARPTAKASLQR